MWEEYGFVGLFAVSFGAATILPVSSELVFASMTGAGFDPVICIWAATAGNWLGGMTTYGLGRLGKTDWLSKYFKISSGRLEQIRGFAAGRGAVAAFFGFLPAVGDVIVFVLGLFKANLTVVAFSMFVGKFLRYCLLAYGVYRESSGWVSGDFRLQKNGLSGSVAKMSGRLISFTGGGYE